MPKVLQRPLFPPTHRGLALALTDGCRVLKRHLFLGLVYSDGELYRYRPPLDYALALPRLGIIQHLSGPNRRRMTLAGHVRRWQTDVCRPRMMLAGHVRCHLIVAIDDAGRPRPTSAGRCEEATDDAARPHLTLADRCAQATTAIGSPLTYVDWSMRVCHTLNRLAYACKPRPMWAGYDLCCLADAHMPQLMWASPNLCHLADARSHY
ncbi:hypothetical protein H5410_015204 [Solanum commersonii]|uniref:Uncharacterized protein n=1 Tax=Solanum commersonii TaxID=4109 RepID=A0A9J5ZTQ4_SOLCO|nr:hypothetical protein H5410_015204 [Solanum commersonii]